MPRPQFTLRALLLLMLVVAAFFGGVRFGREWQRSDEKGVAASANIEPDAAQAAVEQPTTGLQLWSAPAPSMLEEIQKRSKAPNQPSPGGF